MRRHLPFMFFSATSHGPVQAPVGSSRHNCRHDLIIHRSYSDHLGQWVRAAKMTFSQLQRFLGERDASCKDVFYLT